MTGYQTSYLNKHLGFAWVVCSNFSLFINRAYCVTSLVHFLLLITFFIQENGRKFVALLCDVRDALQYRANIFFSFAGLLFVCFVICTILLCVAKTASFSSQ
jgi:hypothetical protein